MTEPTSLIAIVIAMAIFLPIALLISAVLLRAAVALYNRLVGGPTAETAVPQLSMTKAVGISLLVSVVNYLIGLVLGLGAGMAADVGAMTLGATEAISISSSLVIGTIVLALALKFVMPTPFVRALRISLCNLVVCLAVGIAVVVIGVTGGIALSATM